MSAIAEQERSRAVRAERERKRSRPVVLPSNSSNSHHTTPKLIAAALLAAVFLAAGIHWLPSFKSVGRWTQKPIPKTDITHSQSSSHNAQLPPPEQQHLQQAPAITSVPPVKQNTPLTPDNASSVPAHSLSPGSKPHANQMEQPPNQERNQAEIQEKQKTNSPANAIDQTSLSGPLRPAGSPSVATTEEPADPTLLHRNQVPSTPSGTLGHDLDPARREPSQAIVKENSEHAATVPHTNSPYIGPTSGSMTWQGEVQGPELIVIENGRANFGSVSGSPLPGVMCMVQISDSKHFSIAVAPAPSNQWEKVVLNVYGKGLMKVRLTWALP